MQIIRERYDRPHDYLKAAVNAKSVYDLDELVKLGYKDHAIPEVYKRFVEKRLLSRVNL